MPKKYPLQQVCYCKGLLREHWDFFAGDNNPMLIQLGIIHQLVEILRGIASTYIGKYNINLTAV